MNWACNHCNKAYDESVKRYPYGLCKECYFTPYIVRPFRQNAKLAKAEPQPADSEKFVQTGLYI
jgi:hypothetical protein